MKVVNIVYWSGTGNTEAMAEAVKAGAEAAGAEVKLVNVSSADINEVKNANVVALGCPAMGAEQLEDSEFEPFMSSLDGEIAGKSIGLFGSFGWGGGEWMHQWESRILNDSAVVVNGAGVVSEGSPDDSVLESCKALGKALADLA